MHHQLHHQMRHVLLDTDIGTNADDALALAVLLGSPDVVLVAVTTVYGDTLLRARLARRLLRLAGRSEVRVAQGAPEPLSGADVWWAGHEGALHPDLAQERIDPEPDAADLILDATRERPGEIDLLAVGPLTNVALALRRDPDLATRLRSVVVMGGDLSDDGTGRPRPAERNFRSDAVAACEVLASGLPVVVAGQDVTGQVRLGDAEVERIGASGPFGAVLRAEIAEFRRHLLRHGDTPWVRPHDAVASLLLLRPDLFRTERRGVRVVGVGESGVSGGDAHGSPQPGVVVDDPDAPARSVARGLDVVAAREEVLRRVTAASAAAAGRS